MSIKKTKTEKAAPPVAKVRVGLITASIWERTTEDKTFYSVSFDRRYRDSSGKWHSSNSFDAHQLLELAKAADLAHTQILQAQAPSEETEEGEGA